jgi:hypothetical protein
MMKLEGKPDALCGAPHKMRENCTSGLMRGSNGIGTSRPLLSTLLP